MIGDAPPLFISFKKESLWLELQKFAGVIYFNNSSYDAAKHLLLETRFTKQKMHNPFQMVKEKKDQKSF